MDLLQHFNRNRCFGCVSLIHYMLVNDFFRSQKTEQLIFFKRNSIYLFLVCPCLRKAHLNGFEFLALHEPPRHSNAATWKTFQIDSPPLNWITRAFIDFLSEACVKSEQVNFLTRKWPPGL